MSTRRNRQTGTRVTVYRDGPQWFTICEDHRQAAEHYTGRAARDWAAAPATWCTSCSEELDRRELDTVEPAEIIRPTWCPTCETVHAAACEPADNMNPHGIPRPSRVDLARTFLVRVAEMLDDELHAGDIDADALDTLAHALDALEAETVHPSRIDRARAYLALVATFATDHGHTDAAALVTIVEGLDTLETLEDPRATDLRDAVRNRGRAIAAGAHGPAALETTGGPQ